MLKKIFLIPCALCALSPHAYAADEALDYLLGLDIKSLADVKVYSASKVEESLKDASASVTRYDSEDMQDLGYYTIGDLADITPGYSTHIRYGERILETRGQRAGSFNNDKHLLLIDGVPIHHARNYKVSTEEDLPLYFADNIEFIRGPASALYGTSAFFGALSIESQSFDGVGYKGATRVTGGTLDAARQVMSNNFYNSDWGRSSLSLGYAQNVASKDFVGTQPTQNWKNYNDKESLFAYGKHSIDTGTLEGLSFHGLYSRKEGGHGEFFLDSNSSAFNKIIWESFIPFVKYERTLSPATRLASFVKYNHSREIGDFIIDNNDISTASQYQSTVQNVETNAELTHQYADDITTIIGINYDARRERGWPDSHSYSYGSSGWEESRNAFMDTTKWFQTASVYGQYQHEFDVLSGLIVTMGARYDRGKAENQKYRQLSPRLAAVQKVTDNINIKANYATALRSPGIKEIGLNNEGMHRVGSLSPETFRTKEIGVNYTDSRFRAGITLFENRTSNAITAVNINTENKFINVAGTTISHGGEVEFKYITDFGLDIGMNFSAARSEDPNNNDLADIPKYKTNLILNYQDDFYGLPYKIAFINKWVSDYTVSQNTFEQSGRHNVSDINARINFAPKSYVEVQLKNLFDNDYRIPNVNREQVAGAGRAAYVSFVRNF